MSGTFVTKFTLLTISNKVFGKSNNEDTNISNQPDVWYQWGGPKMRRNVVVIKLSSLKTIRTLQNLGKQKQINNVAKSLSW